MTQFKIILQRLQNPSVILSIVSQIVTIIVLIKSNAGVDAVSGIITAITSIFVILGIISNPSTENNGYHDDIHECAYCKKQTLHVKTCGNLVCSECGEKHPIEK